MNGNKSFLHAEGLKLCTWLVVGQLCFKVSWSYLPISSYFRGIALTNKTKKNQQHLIWSFQMKVSTILNMKETQFCVLKLCFTLEIIYVYRLYKAKQNEIIFVGVKLIFTYFLCC